MGLSARCRATRGRRTTDGEAHLEGDRLTFRGGFRITVPFDSITAVRVQTGTLILECPDGRLALRIGAGAEKWAEKIRNPRSRIDKLGIKPGAKVTVLGLEDPKFEKDLRDRTSDISRRMRKDTESVFLGAQRTGDLARMDRCRANLAQHGALWVVYPRGHQDITRAEVMNAGKMAGLVDVKIVKFSESHTALKFVIPLAKRLNKP